MKIFSKAWNRSKNPRKQRKYRLTAPLHVKHKLVGSLLSKELRKKYGKRNMGVRKGDKVKIMRGKFKKLEGKIERINLKKIKVFISGVELTKKDGSKKMLAVHPSKIMITELNLDDKLRRQALERK